MDRAHDVCPRARARARVCGGVYACPYSYSVISRLIEI